MYHAEFVTFSYFHLRLIWLDVNFLQSGLFNDFEASAHQNRISSNLQDETL
jgi:hypothetical protein